MIFRFVLLQLVILLPVVVVAEEEEADQSILADTEYAADSWAKPVSGFTPPEAGEHPRLFFRQGDVAKLRERAATAEGQKFVKRLRFLLDGSDGTGLTDAYSSATEAYDVRAKRVQKTPGAFTVSHPFGYGMLYQLTGEKKYAEFARQSLEKLFAGQRDKDDRYAWVKPGGNLRAGPTLGWVAAAYDVCYDAWPDDFRREVLQRIQGTHSTSEPGETVQLEELVFETRHHPTSNHWGAQIGGAGLAVLATIGDPGSDEDLMRSALPEVERRAIAAMTEGFGNAGAFAEGPGPSQMAANTSLIPFLQAMRVCGGRDLTHEPNAWWITMRWAHDIVSRDGEPYYPIHVFEGAASYGHAELFRGSDIGGMSHGGWFSQGFGAIPEEMKPALLWTWETFVKQASDAREAGGDMAYPHHAALALVNWPIGTAPRNPGEVLPHIRHDTVLGFISFRNRWQDENDTIVNAFAHTGPTGWIGRKRKDKKIGSEINLWGGGDGRTLGSMDGGEPRLSNPQPDGSGVFANGKEQFAVDFSGQAGVEALVATTTSPWLRDPINRLDNLWIHREIKLGPDKRRVLIGMINSSGRFPMIPYDKSNPTDVAVIGNQTLRFRDGLLTFESLEGKPPGLGDKAFVAAENPELVKWRDDQIVKAEEIKLPKDPPAYSLSFDKSSLQKHKDKVQLKAEGGPVAELQGGEANFVPGIAGEALQLDGHSQFLVVAPADVVAMHDRDISFSIWVRLPEPVSGEAIIFEKNYWTSGADDLFQLSHFDNGDLYFSTKAGGKSSAANIDLGDDRWHHIVVTYQLEGRNVVLYLDGSKIAGDDARTPAPGKGALHLGARGDPAGANRFLAGALDDFQVWHRVLTRGEVKALYQKCAE